MGPVPGRARDEPDAGGGGLGDILGGGAVAASATSSVDCSAAGEEAAGGLGGLGDVLGGLLGGGKR